MGQTRVAFEQTPRPKRGLTREEAAEYCGIKPTTFDSWVRNAKMPKPVEGTKRWDIRALERAWDKLSGLMEPEQEEDDEFAQWVRKNGPHG